MTKAPRRRNSLKRVALRAEVWEGVFDPLLGSKGPRHRFWRTAEMNVQHAAGVGHAKASSRLIIDGLFLRHAVDRRGMQKHNGEVAV